MLGLLTSGHAVRPRHGAPGGRAPHLTKQTVPEELPAQSPKPRTFARASRAAACVGGGAWHFGLAPRCSPRGRNAIEGSEAVWAGGERAARL